MTLSLIPENSPRNAGVPDLKKENEMAERVKPYPSYLGRYKRVKVDGKDLGLHRLIKETKEGKPVFNMPEYLEKLQRLKGVEMTDATPDEVIEHFHNKYGEPVID